MPWDTVATVAITQGITKDIDDISRRLRSKNEKNPAAKGLLTELKALQQLSKPLAYNPKTRGPAPILVDLSKHHELWQGFCRALSQAQRAVVGIHRAVCSLSPPSPPRFLRRDHEYSPPPWTTDEVWKYKCTIEVARQQISAYGKLSQCRDLHQYREMMKQVVNDHAVNPLAMAETWKTVDRLWCDLRTAQIAELEKWPERLEPSTPETWFAGAEDIAFDEHVQSVEMRKDLSIAVNGPSGRDLRRKMVTSAQDLDTTQLPQRAGSRLRRVQEELAKPTLPASICQQRIAASGVFTQVIAGAQPRSASRHLKDQNVDPTDSQAHVQNAHLAAEVNAGAGTSILQPEVAVEKESSLHRLAATDDVGSLANVEFSAELQPHRSESKLMNPACLLIAPKGAATRQSMEVSPLSPSMAAVSSSSPPEVLCEANVRSHSRLQPLEVQPRRPRAVGRAHSAPLNSGGKKDIESQALLPAFAGASAMRHHFVDDRPEAGVEETVADRRPVWYNARYCRTPQPLVSIAGGVLRSKKNVAGRESFARLILRLHLPIGVPGWQKMRAIFPFQNSE